MGPSMGTCVYVCVLYEYLSRYIYMSKGARGKTIILSTEGDQGIYGGR